MTPLERVKKAEEELRLAREEMERPQASKHMKKILSAFSQFDPEIIEDNESYPFYAVLIKTQTPNTGVLSHFQNLKHDGLFVGNAGWHDDGVILYFFTDDSS